MSKIRAVFGGPREAMFQSVATSSLLQVHEHSALVAVYVPDGG